MSGRVGAKKHKSNIVRLVTAEFNWQRTSGPFAKTKPGFEGYRGQTKMEIYRRIIVIGLFLSFCFVGLSAAKEKIKIGHLTYHTGAYGEFGPLFDNVTEFALNIINQDPPLGRQMIAIHQDIGTIGEARAARRLIEFERVNILLNPAHDYMNYRDFVLAKISQDQSPLLPSVHGGAIKSTFGGTRSEPLFRGSPMDSAQAIAALNYAKQAGKRSVVFIASDASGSQLQAAAAKDAALKLDIEVLAALNMQPNLPNYRNLVNRVAQFAPDAVIIFSAPADGGQFVKNAASAGHSWFIMGTSEWQEDSFLQTATLQAIESHEDVVLAAFANNKGPAWEDYLANLRTSLQANMIGDPSNSYAMQFYDLLIATALAIEKAGTVQADKWSEAMFAVTSEPGVTIHNYQDGIKAIRAGQEINYDGVTGPMDFSQTGIPAGLLGIYKWVSDQYLEQIAVIQGNQVLALDQ